MAEVQVVAEGGAPAENVPLKASGAPTSQSMVDGPMCKVDSLKISQKVDALEVFTGGCCEKQNRYKVYAPGAGKVFKVKEESDCMSRICCNPFHKKTLHINEDEDGWEDYVMESPFSCGCLFACCNICRPEATTYRKNGMEKVGYVKRPTCGGVFRSRLDIFDKNDVQTGYMQGPLCCISPFMDSTFKYYDMAGVETGAQITREFPGCCKVLCTDADDFEMKFSPDMDENARANMVGTMLLLDFMHFENDKALELCTREDLCKLKLCDWYCCGCIIPEYIRIPKNGGGAE
jgi:hypothetical protein